jgi:pimeloyl-ACP methyl ester carboxylesterase
VALNGISFGGYFAVRAAVFDTRIQALIANSPIVDWHRYLTGFIGFDPAQMPNENDFTPETIAQVPDRFMNPVTKRMSVMMMARYGRPSFIATYQALRNYTVREADLKNIRCPVLALVGAGEGAEPRRQLERFANSVSGPVTRYVFTTAEGADGHCQVGNPTLSCAVMFDWLDEIFQ